MPIECRPLGSVRGEAAPEGVWFGYEPDQPVVAQPRSSQRPLPARRLGGAVGAGQEHPLFP